MSLITGGIATMVPCVTNASASLSAEPTTGGGGGGGGGAGPNLVVSTLSAANYIDAPALSGQIRMEPVIGQGGHFVYISSGVNTSELIFTPSTIQVKTADLVVSSINGQSPGGGGSSGPVINVSTINFGDAGGSVGTIDLSATHALNITDGATPAIGDIEIRTNSAGVGTTDNHITIIAPGGNNSLNLASGDDGISYVSGLSSLTMTASSIQIAGPTTISSIFVSSVNGQPVDGGGGGGPNLTLSSITMNLSSVISGVSTIIPGNQNLTIQDGLNGSIVEMDLKNNNVVLTLNSGGAPQATFTASGSGDDLTIQGTGAASMVLSGGNMALTGVSSINGSAYSPTGSVYPKVSSIGVGGGGVQTVYNSISTNSLAQFTTSFDVEIGHLYQISWNYSLYPSAPASYGEYAQFQAYGAVLAPARAINVDLSVSTISQGQLVLAAAGNGQGYLGCVTNTTSPVTLDLGYTTTNVELIDMGPIATSF